MASLLVKIFIGYGNNKAHDVAISLRAFLSKEGLDPFLASPTSPDVPSGLTEPQFKALIRENIIDCHVIVFVCHNGTPKSKPAKEELDYIMKSKLNRKMILFSKCDDCIPKSVKTIWHPIYFAQEEAEESFRRLLNEIFKQYVRITKPPEMKLEDVGGKSP
jgi:hypothetical protein